MSSLGFISGIAALVLLTFVAGLAAGLFLAGALNKNLPTAAPAMPLEIPGEQLMSRPPAPVAPRGPGRPSVLTEPQVAAAIRGRHEGRTMTDLAKEAGVDRTTLYRELKRTGVQFRKGWGRPTKAPDVAAAAAAASDPEASRAASGADAGRDA